MRQLQKRPSVLSTQLDCLFKHEPYSRVDHFWHRRIDLQGWCCISCNWSNYCGRRHQEPQPIDLRLQWEICRRCILWWIDHSNPFRNTELPVRERRPNYRMAWRNDDKQNMMDAISVAKRWDNPRWWKCDICCIEARSIVQNISHNISFHHPQQIPHRPGVDYMTYWHRWNVLDTRPDLVPEHMVLWSVSCIVHRTVLFPFRSLIVPALHHHVPIVEVPMWSSLWLFVDCRRCIVVKTVILYWQMVSGLFVEVHVP